MLIALVFIFMIAAMAATIWLTIIWHTDRYDGGPDCDGEECDAGRNVICYYCYGLIELNCGCPIMPLARAHRWCQCAKPQRSDGPRKWSDDPYSDYGQQGG
jgi:hypothetical protein